jgi:hypothetical protein
MNVVPTEVHDKDGNLTQIEFYDFAGNFIFQAAWDDNDEQTSENREAFRKWADRMAKQLGYEVSR